MLRQADLRLSKAGSGRIVLSAPAPRAGRAWTDKGTARQERAGAQRRQRDPRRPHPPGPGRAARARIKRFGATSTDGSSRPPGVRRPPPISASPRPSASRTPRKTSVTRATAASSRHPEMAGQSGNPGGSGRCNRSHHRHRWSRSGTESTTDDGQPSAGGTASTG